MPVYFTPGPTQLHPKMRQFITEAFATNIMSISHRSAEFSSLYENVDKNLKKLLNIPQDFRIFFVGSATEAMERTLQGLAVHSSQHFVNGAFGEKWHEIAGQLGLYATKTETPTHIGAKHDYTIKRSAEIVCMTHNETSTGATMPDDLLLKLAKKANSMGKLVAVDIVSSAPFVNLPWEYIDSAFFSVQKNFSMPAGLGVMIISPRAIKAARKILADGHSIGSYHSLVSLDNSAAKFQNPATPNVLGIFLLDRVVEDFLSDIENLKNNTRKKADTLYELIKNSKLLNAYIEDPLWRSNSVIVARVTGGNSGLYSHLSKNKIIIGKGYKNDKDTHIRIANFPGTSDDSFAQLIELIKSL